MKLAHDVTGWDYEWDASSGTLPPGMAVRSYNFTDDPGAMLATTPNLDFNYIGAAEIRVEMKWPAAGNKTSSPQIIVKRADKAGAKVYGRTSETKVMTNISGSGQATPFNDYEYHIIDLKYDGEVFTLTIDGVTYTGPGALNNNYIHFTGISSDYSSQGYFRSIKFRALA